MRGSFIVGEKLVTPEHKYFLPTLNTIPEENAGPA